jgi:soluble lytic murein transglycosylase-like protein
MPFNPQSGPRGYPTAIPARLRAMRLYVPALLLPLLLLAGANALADTTDSGTDNETRALITSALHYEHAEGVPRDFEKAAALYCKAARLGDADAQYALGWMYANGRGVARDDATAAQIFALAADRGHPGAKVMRSFTATKVTAPPDAPIRLQLQADALSGPGMDEAYFKRPIFKLVEKLSQHSGIDPKLVMAVILVESGFNPRAQSPKNAQGLMQLIPETAQRFRVKDAFDPEDNIKGGIAYLKWLLNYFKGDVALVAAAYNAGEGTVEKYRGVPPYPETQKYVKRIAQLYQKALHPYDAAVVILPQRRTAFAGKRQ